MLFWAWKRARSSESNKIQTERSQSTSIWWGCIHRSISRWWFPSGMLRIGQVANASGVKLRLIRKEKQTCSSCQPMILLVPFDSGISGRNLRLLVSWVNCHRKYNQASLNPDEGLVRPGKYCAYRGKVSKWSMNSDYQILSEILVIRLSIRHQGYQVLPVFRPWLTLAFNNSNITILSLSSIFCSRDGQSQC